MSFKKQSIAILGSTGSIGTTTLKILENLRNIFSVDLLSCNSNKKKIFKQIKKFLPKFVIISDIEIFNYFTKIKFKKKIKFFQSLKHFTDFYTKKKIRFDKVILGISSINGLDYAFSFINFSNYILVANKETIVCGGNFFLKSAKKARCKIEPIDSEHYCINSCLKNYNTNKDVKVIYLTASGGPFLNKKFNEISKIEPKFALAHPKWKMGKKISIDSATMANKGLEIMEAAILFQIEPSKIKVKIHHESKVHSAVILNNGLVHLLAHNTSMTIPIKNTLLKQNSLLDEKNFFLNHKKFSFTFDEVDLKKFKMLSLAYKSLSLGDRACIFYNVINDFYVTKYLQKKIFFYQIYNNLNKIINDKILKNYYKKKIKSLNDIYETINYAKNYVKKI